MDEVHLVHMAAHMGVLQGTPTTRTCRIAYVLSGTEFPRDVTPLVWEPETSWLESMLVLTLDLLGS